MGIRTGRPQRSQDRLREQLRYADRKQRCRWLQKHLCRRELSPWQKLAGARFVA